jgi:hypothetical protein
MDAAQPLRNATLLGKIQQNDSFSMSVVVTLTHSVFPEVCVFIPSVTLARRKSIAFALELRRSLSVMCTRISTSRLCSRKVVFVRATKFNLYSRAKVCERNVRREGVSDTDRCNS